MFIDQLKSSALEDCAAFYESDITVLLMKYEKSAVNETELMVRRLQGSICFKLFVLHIAISCLPLALLAGAPLFTGKGNHLAKAAPLWVSSYPALRRFQASITNVHNVMQFGRGDSGGCGGPQQNSGREV